MNMPGRSTGKIECLNPNTGGKMKIDAKIYDLFSEAIYQTVKENKQGVTFTDIVKGIKRCFEEEQTNFKGSVEWYAVTVKNDMVANEMLFRLSPNGKKKLHKLSATSVSR